MTHGGKRRHHVAPALTTAEVLRLRYLRDQQTPYKVLMRLFKVSRETLSRAVNASRTYRGMA